MRENVRNVSRGRAGRERWEFALDTRQIAAVAVGVLVIVGSSFVLGMNTGKGLARRSAAPATATGSLDAFDTAHANLPAPPEPKSWEYEKLGGTSRGSDSTAHAAPAGAAASTAQARVPPPARPLPRANDEVASQAAAATAAAPSSASTQPAAAQPAPAATASAAVSAPPAKNTPSSVATTSAPAKSPAPAPASPSAAKPSAPAPSAMDRAIAAVGGSPVKTSTTTVASAAASGGGAFVIQVGASPNRAEADRIAKKFAARGARVVAADVDGKRWYRVRLASTTYDSRNDAERALSRLARETGVRGFVTAAR